MFPAGAPGIALWILRLCTAGMLFVIAFPRGTLAVQTWELVVISLLALLLGVGIFTPVACALSSLVELTTLWSLSGMEFVLQIFAVLVTISLWMLGPGAFSLDAKFFGRRVIFPSSE